VRIFDQPESGCYGDATQMEERDRRAGDGDAREQMLAGLPISERRLDLAGVATAVHEGGDGPPLILLHGAIECGGAIWAPVVSQLAERYSLVIPDLPGLGESEPLARLDATSFADWFRALIAATCREKPDLIAHSMGGGLAVRFAVRYGELMRQLVVYAGPGIGPYRIPLGLMVVAIRFGLRPTEGNAERFDRRAFFDFDRAREHDPEWFRAFAAYSLSRAVVPHVKRTMSKLLKSGKARVPDTDLRRIEIPTALLWGKHDRFVPLGVAEGAHARLGWPLHLLDDAGHVSHIERPAAFINALETALGGGSRVER
jgi:pimeloyl-ACP methyl ester carboxylesterase